MNRAIVVGAGIGGLAAAIALRKAGWDVEVLERAATPGELGFALFLAPNGMIALRALGLFDRVEAGGVVAEAGELRRADGKVLKRLDFRFVHERSGAPSVNVMRTVLHGALLDTVGSAALRLGNRVVAVALGPESVAVTLESGEVRHGRILIGADGVQSIVRRSLHPDEPAAHPAGVTVLRGLTRNMPADLGSAIYLGKGFEAGTGPVGADAVYWFVGARMPAEAEAAGDPRVQHAPFIDQLHEPFRAMVARGEERDLRRDVLLERKPLTRWGSGAATLLGDAAHPMLPNAGQGAAQALEDAVALGVAMASPPNAEDGLREYERVRIPRTSTIVRLARQNARLAAMNSGFACAVRDFVIPLVPAALILKRQVDLAAPAGRINAR